MDTAFRSPLVDLFRRGEVDREVRMLAAAGAFAPRAHEQVALLILLAEDSDPDISSTAETTLARIPPAALAAYLARSDVGADVRDFFARRGITPAGEPAQARDEPLLGPSDEGEGGAARTAEPAAAAGAAGPAPADVAGEPQPGAVDSARQGTAQRLALLTVAQRVKAAMQGTRDERTVLIRDPNRLVAAAVLSSPKLTESEVEAIARMTNVSDDVLRAIGTTRTWIRNYNVISALARNAKTPIAISLGLLNRLNERDIKGLSTDRNVPEPVRVAARKMYVHTQSRRQ